MDKLFLQKIYSDNVGARLERFKVQQHSPYRAIFRCPICGDSATNKFRRRGFLIERNGTIMFHCHNQCGTINFEHFLNEHFNDLYIMYKFELIKYWKEEQQNGRRNNRQRDDSNRGSNPLENQKQSKDLKLSLAKDNKDSYAYITDRKIPSKFYDDIYYTDKFYDFINEHIPNKFPDEYIGRIDRRIVIPMRDFDGTIFGVVGRAIDKSNKAKYLTIKFDDSKPKISGLDRLDRSKFTFVLEGPIDSYFVDNAIAFAGTDGSPELIFDDKSKYAIVLDNQPRSESVLKKYEKYINDGFQMVIWPENVADKDINQMIIDGSTQQEIQQMLVNNTYSGIKLKIMFAQWRKL